MQKSGIAPVAEARLPLTHCRAQPMPAARELVLRVLYIQMGSGQRGLRLARTMARRKLRCMKISRKSGAHRKRWGTAISRSGYDGRCL